jgi:iron complex outermembrane receptor protein
LPAIVNANLAAGPRSTTLWPGLKSQRKMLFAANTTTWEINDSLTLKNVLGYVDRQDQSSADYDGSALPLVDFRQLNMPNFWVRQVSEELQLQGTSFEDKLEWIAGVYADHSHPGGRAGNERVLFFAGDVAEVHEDNSSIAGFAQGSYDLSEALLDGLKLTVGARYTYERNKSETFESKTTPTQPPQPNFVCLVAGSPPDCVNKASSSQDAVTYNVGLDYQVTDDTMLYIVTRKGYKGGGYQVYFPRPDFNKYEAETIKDVELGVKSAFSIGDMQGRVNVAGFYAEQKDIQRLAILVDTTVSPPTPYSFIANAAAATVKGVDFETSLLPVDSLRVDLRYTYTDYQYDRTAAGLAACQGVSSSASKPVFCPLNMAPGTPEHHVSASVRYTLPTPEQFGEIAIGAEYSYQSDVALSDESYTSGLTGNDYNAVDPAYDLVNATLTWTDMFGKPLDLTVFGTNLGDKLYRSGSNNLSSNVGFASYFYGEPRMYGASLKYRFGASR